VAVVAIVVVPLFPASPPPALALAASAGTNPPTAFSCQPYFYQFSDDRLYRFNSVSGSYDDTDLDDSGGDDGNNYMDDVPAVTDANGVGYNPADNYIYAISSGELVRVGQDGWVNLGAPTGSTTVRNTAGDFIADNVLLTASGNNFSKITVNDSPTVEGYSTSGKSWAPADFTVDSNGTYAYGMSSTTLYRLTISSGLVETQSVSMSGNNGGSGWGSAYATSDGDLFFYQNTGGSSDGQIWKIASDEVENFVDGGSALSSEQILTGQSLSTPNDGASCPDATSPFNPPVIVNDSYAFTTGTTFVADSASLGAIDGDSVSSTGAVLYKVGLSSDLTTNTQERLPSDSGRTSSTVAAATNSGSQNSVSNGSQTVTITDWDTGEFEVTGLSGTFTFYYQLVEEDKSSFESTRRLSGIGSVTISTLNITANAFGSGNLQLPDATEDSAYAGHTFEAVVGNDATPYWHAEFIEVGSGGSLPNAPDGSISLPQGLSLNSETGVLSGTPTGLSLGSETEYTIRVYASIDDQFKAFDTKDFSLSIHLTSAIFSVSYGSNSGTSGSAPSDSDTYSTGATVTVLANTGSLERAGFRFVGWNTASDGSGTRFAASGSVTTTMPSGGLSLYAEWVRLPSSDSGEDDDESPGSIATPTSPRDVTAPRQRPATTTPTPANENVGTRPQSRARSADPDPEPATQIPTVDGGEGVRQGDVSVSGLVSSESARRSLAKISEERLTGFLASAPVTIEVRGARTAARFVTDEEILTNPPLLLEQVALASQSSVDTFFAVQNLALSDTPSQPFGPLPEDNDTINELFSSAGLDQPRTLTDTERDALGASGWIDVQSTVREYKPGSTVYLVVNSEPLIVGHATVGDDGIAQIDGDIPISWFGIGEHRIRAVGVKQFDGIQVDQYGELVIPENVLGKIREFDLGTQATILASGPNPDGSSHLAIRVVPLEPDAPWWTLWILAGAFALMLLARIRGILATRSQAVIGGFAVLMAAIPGIVLGWTSTVTIVAVWAAILGLVGAILLVTLPARRTDTVRRGS
jgi:hypothetical protein